MVIEEIPENASKDLKEENEDLLKRYGGKPTHRVLRLSFFTCGISNEKELDKVESEEFIGYAVVKIDTVNQNLKRTRIYESVVRPSRHDNIYVHGAPEWSCQVGENQFTVSGYLYAQQNAMTNVCAHVALRTVIGRFLPHEMSYRRMNQLAGFDHSTRKAGGNDGDGMDRSEMETILDKAGLKSFIEDYTDAPNKDRPPFQKSVYASIESGYPAIIIFELRTGLNFCMHAVPVFGHTFNDDTWVPNAENFYFKVGRAKYIPSESWVSMYLAHDDNWGSNYCIPRHYLHTRGKSRSKSKSKNPKPPLDGRVAYVISTFPKNIKLKPVAAEVIGMNYLSAIFSQIPDKSGTWGKRLRGYARISRMVVRLKLVRKNDYIAHLKKLKDWQGNILNNKWLKLLEDTMPDEYFWMIEMSIIELFSTNKRKLGEVLLRAEKEGDNKQDFKSLFIARVPGYFTLFSGCANKVPKFKFFPCALTEHVPLYGCE